MCEMRQTVVEWIVEVINMFNVHICQRSLFLSVTLINQYLCRTRMSEATEQTLCLLAATCFHIASKCEDVAYIGIQELMEAAE